MPLPDIDSARNWGADAWTDAEPTIEPTTELAANTASQMAVDIAMATHTQGRALVRFVCVAYTSGSQAITVVDHEAVWGSLPPLAPSVVQTATGRYVITWTATQYDELGNAHTLNCRFPRAPSVIGNTDGRARVVSFTSNSVTIQAYDTSDAASALAGNSICVEW